MTKLFFCTKVVFLIFLSGALGYLVTRRVDGRFFNRELKIAFMSVGQGDAILISFPGSSRWLIDAGGTVRRGGASYLHERILRELTRNGIQTLDTVVLTHPDWDHGQGLLDLFDRFRVLKLMIHERSLSEIPMKPLLRSILARAYLRKVSVQNVSQPIVFPFPQGLIEILPVDGVRPNDRALVVLLSYGSCRVLFAADIEKNAEQNLLKAIEHRPIGSYHILKVAHHGSRTSCDFKLLERIRPSLSVVSVGLANRYNHPHWQPAEKLRQVGSQLVRTDFHGTIYVTLSKNHWKCESDVGFCGTSICH